MLPQALDATALSHAIQNAVVPVFLLTGIGAMLAVLANRLGRIVDFARVLEGRLPASSEKERVDTHRRLTVLSRRARLIYAAISLSVLCALLICTVIVLLFVEVFLSLKIPGLIGVLFIVAMLAFIVALICFLREVYLATVTLRIGSH
ncbi:MAG TPA: DUF2721 domain-containing protein [Burkholderiales bacterium]|nr:DUF2721 domain-containing protein [Burkholderiales bacterium]